MIRLLEVFGFKPKDLVTQGETVQLNAKEIALVRQIAGLDSFPQLDPATGIYKNFMQLASNNPGVEVCLQIFYEYEGVKLVREVFHSSKPNLASTWDKYRRPLKTESWYTQTGDARIVKKFDDGVVQTEIGSIVSEQ